MSKQQFNYLTIEEALLRAEQQKQLYERNLVGKSFIYAYVDKSNTVNYKEIHFDKENYLHLTGLDYQSIQYSKRVLGVALPTDALNFYNRLGNDITLINDMSFIQGSTYEETSRFFKYTQHKLDNLSQLTAIAAKAEYIGKYKGNQDFDIIVNRNKSAIAFIREDNSYIPVSSLFGRAEDVATDIKPVLAIFVKENEHSQYKMLYLNSKINIGRKLFTPELYNLLTQSAFINSDVKFNKIALDAIQNAYDITGKKLLTESLDVLAQKRNEAFNDSTALENYEKQLSSVIESIDNLHKGENAINNLENQNIEKPNSLINEEISSIKNKISGFSKPSVAQSSEVKRPTIMKMEFSSPDLNVNSSASRAVALTPPNFLDVLREAAKEIKSMANYYFAELPVSLLDKLTKQGKYKVHSHTLSEAHKATQPQSKDNFPVKAKTAKKQHSEPSVAHSEKEAAKEEERPSLRSNLRSIQKELEQQHKEAPKKEKSLSKKNDIDIS